LYSIYNYKNLQLFNTTGQSYFIADLHQRSAEPSPESRE